ncbi:MAG: hypothetical protein R6U92_05525 [Bacillota bacterium]
MLTRRLIAGLVGGLVGFVVGILSGGYLGLVIGGTFLGGLDVRSYIGMEGYEISAYIGAILAALITTPLGVSCGLSSAEKGNERP